MTKATDMGKSTNDVDARAILLGGVFKKQSTSEIPFQLKFERSLHELPKSIADAVDRCDG